MTLVCLYYSPHYTASKLSPRLHGVLFSFRGHVTEMTKPHNQEDQTLNLSPKAQKRARTDAWTNSSTDHELCPDSPDSTTFSTGMTSMVLRDVTISSRNSLN